MTEFSDEYTNACNVIACVVNVIALFGFVLSLMVHWRNVYLDLFTAERSSVAHRRRAPEMTKDYRNVAYCTCIAGLMGCITASGKALAPFVMGSSPYSACAMTEVISTLMLPTKVFVYFIFSLRYQMVYGGSQYAIQEGKLKFVNAFLASIGMFLYIWGISQLGLIYFDGNETNEDFTGGLWALGHSYSNVFNYTCYITAPDLWILMYALFDVFVTIVFCYKFIKPILQVIRLVQGSSRNVIEKSKLEKKMLFVGFKVFILSAVLLCSTIVLVILYSGVLAPPLALTPLDQFINFWCLALMTPYYPDSKYYQKLCACCIFCCDRKGYTKKAELNDEKSSGNGDIAIGAQSPRDDNDNDKEAREVTEEQTVFSSVSDPNQSGSAQTQTQTHAASVDTMSAVRIATNEEASPMTSDGKNTRDQTSAEVELAQNLNDQRETQ